MCCRVAAALACLALYGCRTKYVAVPQTHTVYVTRERTDTVRDSVSVYERETVFAGKDTVYRLAERTVYRDRYVSTGGRDTVVLRDSVAVPYPAERTLTRWEQVRISSFWWLVAGILAFGAVIVGWLVRSGGRR